MLGRDLFLPVCIGDLSLLEPVLGEIRICPYCGAVAIELGPVALHSCQLVVNINLRIIWTYVPSGSTIVALSGIVETLAVTAHKQDLVHGIEVRISVQRVHDLSESLPLSSVPGARTRVCLVDKAKVDSGLHHYVRCVLFRPEGATYVVKARSNSIRLILQEVASDSGVLDVSRTLGRVKVLSF
jgi:hypothetical protein